MTVSCGNEIAKEDINTSTQQRQRAEDDASSIPTLTIQEDGSIYKNKAYLEREAKDAELYKNAVHVEAVDMGTPENKAKYFDMDSLKYNLNSNAITSMSQGTPSCASWTNPCKLSTKWLYKGYATKDKRLESVIKNNSGLPKALEYKKTYSRSGSFTATGGLDSSVIKMELGYSYSSYFSTEISLSVPAGKSASIYTYLTGTGGNGTQYRYPQRYASCSAAGAECYSANFSAFSPSGAGYEVTR